jgi:hypothetical protein
MPVNPLVVDELRSLFKLGATPSALIRRIAERHAGEPKLDVLVRAYFREAFHVPMVRIGTEQVKQIAEGGSLPVLIAAILHRMVQTRAEWDRPESRDDSSDGCWLDAVMATDEAATTMSPDPKQIPELAGSWDRMDDEAKEFIKRLIGNSHSLHEKVDVIATLAERLQQRVKLPAVPIAQGA